MKHAERPSAHAAPARAVGPEAAPAHVLARVRGVEALGGGAHLMRLAAPEVAHRARAGQFLHVQCVGPAEDLFDPLLRRPLSLHRILREHGEVEVLFAVVGRGTALLAQSRGGDLLDVVGPLGRPFPPADEMPLCNAPQVWLVGGGIGAAPLLAAAEEIAAVLGRERVVAYLGAGSRGGLWRVAKFAASCGTLHLVTEDGSIGLRGLVTDLVAAEAPAARAGTVCLACGPTAMLAEVARILEPAGVRCFLSLEARLACGLGSCQGCAVRARTSGYKLVCSDGPVFESGEVSLP